MSYQNVTWRGWLLRQHTTDSSLLLVVGGDNPGRAIRRIESALKYGRIDQESHDYRVALVQQMHSKFLADAPVVNQMDPKDWQTLGNGAMLRRTHIKDTSQGES